MLVLAPDPRLGVAPERVARVRALLAAASERVGGDDAVPGIVVALPGGAGGVLDALVLRPDGVTGLVPSPVRESVGARAGGHGDARSGSTAAGDTGVGDRELDRLLGLTDPPCAVPRRLRSSAGQDSDTPADAAAPDAAAPDAAVPDDAAEALAAPLGAVRTVGVSDVRRLLEAFRLREHVPDDHELVALGFVPVDGDAPAPHPSFPGAPPVIPEARRPSRTDDVTDTGRDDRPRPGDRVDPVPRDEPAPVTAPMARVASDARHPTPSPGPASSPSSAPAPSRAGDPRPGLPATGRLASLVAPGRSRRRPPRGVLGLPPWPASWAARLAPWGTGYRGLALAAVGAFLAALGLALLVGRVTGAGSAPAPAPAPMRVVDGVAFTRAAVASDQTCAGHAYGQAAQFLTERPCARLDRALWTATVDGRSVIVAVAGVQMTDTVSAGALKSLIDTPGTGNVSDLLREGRGYPGAPAALTDAGYASALLGDGVVVVEADRIDGPAMTGDQLDALSRSGLGLS